MNGRARSLQTFRKIQAYITQDDFLLPYLSVDEAMMAAANLKLGRGFDHHSRRMVVSGDDNATAPGGGRGRAFGLRVETQTVWEFVIGKYQRPWMMD